MLKKLEAKNFQSHKYLSIEFDKRVTSIVGPSDVGKSAVIRMIQWALLNRPSGEAFIRYGTKKTAVKITTKDNNKLVRVRGNGENLYRLNDMTFKAFGNDVPETITSAHNISNLNFQAQHDSPFWFCETAGEVSRQLNKIVNLDIIDSTLTGISSDIRKQNSAKDVINRRVDRLQQQEKDLEYLDSMELDLRHVESLFEERERHSSELAVLQKLYKDTQKYSRTRKVSLALILAGSEALQKGREWLNLQQQVDELTKLLAQAKKLTKISKNRPPSIKKLENLASDCYSINEDYKTLEQSINQWKNYNQTIEQCQKELKTLKKTLTNEIGTVCPLCNQPIK